MFKIATSLFITALAVTPAAADSGFSGQAGIYLGGSTLESNLSTESPSHQNALTAPSDRTSEALIIPMWNIEYAFGRHAVYYRAGIVEMTDDFYSELGFKQQLASGGSIGLGYVPGLLTKDEWADPFALDQPRKSTEARIKGFLLHFEDILAPGLSLNLGYGEKSIDQEQSGVSLGQSPAELSREGDIYYTGATQTWQINTAYSLSTHLRYRRFDAQSQALSNDKIAGSLGAEGQFGRHIGQLEFELGQANFDDTHPLFETVRKDTHLGLSATYIYAAPFGWRDAALVTRLTHTRQHSNIDFYDETEWMALTGVDFRF